MIITNLAQGQTFDAKKELKLFQVKLINNAYNQSISRLLFKSSTPKGQTFDAEKIELKLF